jgi:tRNA-Thr(GGU) m(6)t(6)A37 methyltransferase TsaA
VAERAPPPYELRRIGVVESPLSDPGSAPKQAEEGGLQAWLAFEPEFAEALADVAPGDRVIILTWLDLADRSTLSVHPRDDAANPLTGVFKTRSQDRPNPIGLHEAEIVAVDGTRVCVDQLEAVDGTPVIDLKPVLR